MNKPITEVIFRKDKDNGDIIAFFPETYQYGTMTSYAHIGQHSDASIQYYWTTKKASPEEYQPLLNELGNIVGYRGLKIKQKMIY